MRIKRAFMATTIGSSEEPSALGKRASSFAEIAFSDYEGKID